MIRKTLFGTALFCSSLISAHEGMWLPTLLKAIEGDMRTEGLLLSAEDIYSLNNGSLKDAICIFGGGCTAELISDQGLVLTNHHCGFGAIAAHSTVEHDYLKDGFMARMPADELRNDDLTVTFIVRMEEVTDRILAGVGAAMNEEERKNTIAKASATIAAEVTAVSGNKAVVRAFNYGNSFFLIETRTYSDVRLVCAPPGGIGKFGGDTDNWMWPRHNADFSIFRIYADAENKPAAFALTNVPYKPLRSLAVSMDGVKEGDFDMIYGFPGSTQRYLSSYQVDYIVDHGDPLRIAMRAASLQVIDAAMLASDRTRIQYADKQSGISNAYKKWIGEVRGLNELRTVERKRDFETDYVARATAAGKREYVEAIKDLEAVYKEYPKYAQARDLYAELIGAGSDVLKFCYGFSPLLNDFDTLQRRGKSQAELDKALASIGPFFKEADMSVDERILTMQLPIFLANVDKDLLAPGTVALNAGKRSRDAVVHDYYARSIFTDSVRCKAALRGLTAKKARKLRKDPLFDLASSVINTYNDRVKPKAAEFAGRIERDMRMFAKGQIDLFPERGAWPDANSTLRLSYGKVEGSDPRDGVHYEPFTTLSGVIAKHKAGDAEFEVPARLIELHAKGDYAPYSLTDEMPVCFTSSLHTTGGNSGSPVLNARGELIGLNFDRTWESTMSDIQFDPAKCRNIAVDIRYVLFVVDKVCGGHRLIDEMALVRHADDPYMIHLPIHR